MAGDGAPVARVRVSLAHAATHRVRSARNMIYVEVDRAVVPHDALSAYAGPMAASFGETSRRPMRCSSLRRRP